MLIFITRESLQERNYQSAFNVDLQSIMTPRTLAFLGKTLAEIECLKGAN